MTAQLCHILVNTFRIWNLRPVDLKWKKEKLNIHCHQSLLAKRLPSSISISFTGTTWKREKVTILHTTFSTLVLDGEQSIGCNILILIKFYNTNEYFLTSLSSFCLLFFHLHVRSILSFGRIALDTYSWIQTSFGLTGNLFIGLERVTLEAQLL